ncbi:MAG TPA: c-type cytochrome [Thermoguttaceae bacterium]|nr:c-type cytochrome [Thermoguttaceae bacterium]
MGVGVLGVVVVPAMLVLLFGRGILVSWARQTAASRINVGSLSAAQQWLDWAARLDPGDAETDLMRAACFRQLYQDDRWRETLESAERKGAPATRVQQEIKLGIIRTGRFREGEESEMGALIEGGASLDDVARAFVYGYLTRKEPERARMVLDAWEADRPDDPHVAYMQGVYWEWSSDRAGDVARRQACFDRAQAEYRNALARQPRHELAGTALAELLENRDRLEESLEQCVALATRCPASETGKVGLARLLRQLGRLDEARAVLKSPASQPEPPSAVAVEVGRIELDSGNYDEAERWFEQVDLDQVEDSQTLTAAATTFALEEKTTHAERLFARIDAASYRSARIEDLLVRLATGPRDQKTADELKRLTEPSTTASAGGGASGTEQAEEDRPQSPATPAADLYVLHCGACHGANGDGNGRAVRHLFPKPRDLRTGKSRLVSTVNGVPTLGDLESVIRRGMPGTSMRAFDNLSEDQRKLLAEEVLRLNREGIREQFVGVLKSEGEEIDEDDVRQVVDLCTTPGEVVHVPPIGPPDAQAITRGKDTYLRLGCEKCHGDDGAGAWDTPLFDDKGRPSPPRDLVREPLKGGEEPESIYLRIFAGMPGTAHPGCWNVPEDRLVDLVHYCRSLSREPKRVLTNHERGLQATRRNHLAAAGGTRTP